MRALRLWFVFAVTLFCSPHVLRAELRVMFVSDKESTADVFDIYTITANGGDLQRVTATAGVSEWAPALSPDGMKIAYIARAAGKLSGDLYVMGAGGSSPVKQSITGEAFAVQWEDDDTLFFLRHIPSAGFRPLFDIRKIDIGAATETVAYARQHENYPTGVDSFHLHRPSSRLYFSDWRTSGISPVTGLTTASEHDRTYLLFDDPNFAPGEGAANGNTLVDHYDIIVSPDGSTMAYCADHGTGSHRLYVRANGDDHTTQVRLSDRYCGDPDFSPDGGWLAFTRAPASTFGASPYIGDIVRVNTDATGDTVLTASLARVSGRCAHPLVYELTSEPPVFRLATVRDGEDFKLSWNDLGAGTRYRVETSGDLKEWDAVPGGENLTTTEFTVRGAFAANVPTFFRIVAL